MTETLASEMDRYSAPPDAPLAEVASVPAWLPMNDMRAPFTCEMGTLTLKIAPPLRAALLSKKTASPARLGSRR